MRPSSANTRSEHARVVTVSPLLPFCFWLPKPAHHRSGPPALASLADGIADHLAGQGWPGAEPLRWAITAVDPVRGWRLEGVAVASGDQAVA
jgi:hypothetical protein